MTKKDYEVIGYAFQKAYAEVRGLGVDQFLGVDIALEEVTEALQKENTRFDQIKFLKHATPIII